MWDAHCPSGSEHDDKRIALAFCRTSFDARAFRRRTPLSKSSQRATGEDLAGQFAANVLRCSLAAPHADRAGEFAYGYEQSLFAFSDPASRRAYHKKHCVMRPGNFRRFLVDSARCEFLGEPSLQSTDVERTKETCAVCFPVCFISHILCNSSCPFLFALSSSGPTVMFCYCYRFFSRDYPEPPRSRRIFLTRSRTRSCAVEVPPIVFRSVAVEYFWQFLLESCTEHAAQHGVVLAS